MNTTPLYPQIGEGDCDGDGYNYAATDNNKGDNDNWVIPCEKSKKNMTNFFFGFWL